MPCWYYEKPELLETPSIRDGITLETERRYRKEGARFIMSCGTQMGLGHNTTATGVVYFHRFYMFHSFKSFPRYVTACCCLLLAGKVEETPKKCRDIIKTARALLSDSHFYSFGEDPKEEVMTLERILLQTIKFDLQVEHPHTFLLKYAKCFKGDQTKLQKMVQMAWNFVNDSLSTVVCLQWEPEIIAVALIHLASKLSKFTVVDWVGKQPTHTRWWDMFVADVTTDIIEDICHQVLDLYQTNQKEIPGISSPPQKPPSRADSPTPITNILLGSSESPPVLLPTTSAEQTENADGGASSSALTEQATTTTTIMETIIEQATTTTIAVNAIPTVVSATIISPTKPIAAAAASLSNNNGHHYNNNNNNNHQHSNNIQSIKSLATVNVSLLAGPPPPPPPPVAAIESLATSLTSNAASTSLSAAAAMNIIHPISTTGSAGGGSSVNAGYTHHIFASNIPPPPSAMHNHHHHHVMNTGVVPPPLPPPPMPPSAYGPPPGAAAAAVPPSAWPPPPPPVGALSSSHYANVPPPPMPPSIKPGLNGPPAGGYYQNTPYARHHPRY